MPAWPGTLATAIFRGRLTYPLIAARGWSVFWPNNWATEKPWSIAKARVVVGRKLSPKVLLCAVLARSTFLKEGMPSGKVSNWRWNGPDPARLPFAATFSANAAIGSPVLGLADQELHRGDLPAVVGLKFWPFPKPARFL